MIQNLLSNWKTTSTGLTMMIGAIVHLIFVSKSGKLEETTVMTAVGLFLGGLGLLVAGDGGKSSTETKGAIADLQNQICAVKQDTATIKKP